MANQGSGAELMELVTQMKGTIDQHFTPTIKDLHDRVQTEVDRVKDWLNDLAHSVDDANQSVPQSFHSASAKIDEMEALVKSEMTETAQAVTTYVGHLHDHKGQTHDLLNNAVSAAHDVTDKLHASDDMHASIGDAISHALDGIHTQVNEHLTTLDGHQHTIVDALHALNDHANTQTTDLVQKLTQTGEFVTEHVQSTVQTHVTNGNDLAGQQKDHFVNSIGEALGGHVGDVIGHVQGFVQTGESLGHVFDGGLGDVLQKVDEVGKLIDEIKPVIELAKKLS
jgi:hypothetical protein